MASTFDDLGLGTEVLKAIKDAGYEKPTPIQEKAIPFVLMNRDVLGCAQTGTGKTASFTLPMIDILAQGRAKARMPRSVILAPTRELAAQVADNFETYGKYHKLTMALLIGGVPFGEQERKLDRGVDVLIATPGRLLDHCERGKVILTDTKMMVIDEADRMLDMGFIPDVEKLITMMPVFRQTIMFSATMPKEIRRLAEKFLSNPKEITVDPPSSVATTVTQGVAYVMPREKRKILEDWMSDRTITNGLIFCNRKRDVASLYKGLEDDGFSVGALHGDMDQFKRLEWLEKFKSQQIKFMVCSDVAARGLDIAAVSHVFNYDVPSNAEDYVHRIGRTGRAGREGNAFMFVTQSDAKNLLAIEKIIKKQINELEEDSTVTREDIFSKEKITSRKGKAPKKSEDKLEARADTPKDEKAIKEKSPKKGKKKRVSRYDDQVGVEEDYNIPFGQTPGVPAFLLGAPEKKPVRRRRKA